MYFILKHFIEIFKSICKNVSMIASNSSNNRNILSAKMSLAVRQALLCTILQDYKKIK